MKVLVTGGAGFIGSCFVRYMLDKHPDYKIINLDRLNYPSGTDFLKDLEGNPNYTFVQGDINDKKVLADIFSQIDCCVNLATETHKDVSGLNTEMFVETNVHGTYNLINMAREFKIYRYVQVSTDEVYGSLNISDKTRLNEKTNLVPNNPYAASKAAADLLVRSYFKTYRVPAVITRCPQNYGPGQHQDDMIPSFIINALKEEPVWVHGNTLKVKDWLYVYDHCEAIDLVLHKGKAGEVYNIGGHVGKSHLDMASFILKQLGKPESLIKLAQDDFALNRKHAMDSSKIRKDLGWKPKTDFKEAMKATINWYKANYDLLLQQNNRALDFDSSPASFKDLRNM